MDQTNFNYKKSSFDKIVINFFEVLYHTHIVILILISRQSFSYQIMN